MKLKLSTFVIVRVKIFCHLERGVEKLALSEVEGTPYPCERR